MAELVRKTPTTLREFMDHANDFTNAEYILHSQTTSRKSKVEQAEGQSKGIYNRKGQEKDQKARKSQYDRRREGNVLENTLGSRVVYSSMNVQTRDGEWTRDNNSDVERTRQY